MTLYAEIDWTTRTGGIIAAVAARSVAAGIGLQAGDELLAINNNPVQDVIDVQYHGADESLELLIRRGEAYHLLEAERDYGQELGLTFVHPTFDTDIRRCNNLCEFCFVLQMAPRFRRTLYIKDDDYRYSFLFGHFVTLTNLNDHDWQRIEQMRLSPLYISVHVTDLEKRRQFLRNPTAPDIMTQLRWLAQRGIDMHTQLVTVPDFNDGPWLRRSISDLATLWPAVQSISVVPVGLTRHHKYQMRVHTPAEAAATLDDVLTLQNHYLREFGSRFVYPTDEWFLVAGRETPPHSFYDDLELHENGLGMVRRFLDDWAELQTEIRAWQANHPHQTPRPTGHTCTLVTGTLFAPILAQTAAAFAALTGVTLEVLPVVNQRLGDTITVAGLLMAGDVVAQLQAQGYGALIILPRIMFDHPDVIALDDLSPADVANRLGRPVALADSMGDVWDALLGTSAVLFPPQ